MDFKWFLVMIGSFDLYRKVYKFMKFLVLKYKKIFIFIVYYLFFS